MNLLLKFIVIQIFKLFAKPAIFEFIKIIQTFISKFSQISVTQHQTKFKSNCITFD